MPVNPRNVLAHLRELRELTEDEKGAQRVAWTPTWLRARAWFEEQLQGLPVERHRDAAGAAANVERAAAGFQPGLHIGQCLEPVTGEPVLILAAVHDIEAENALGSEFFEWHAAAALEGGGDIGREPQQTRHDREQTAHEMVGVVRGEQIGVLVGEAIGLRGRVVVEIPGAGHALEPFLDVARHKLALARDVFDAHSPLAGHGAKQPGLDADIPHAGGHGAGHVGEHRVGERLYPVLVHDPSRRSLASLGGKAHG
jgi:hypothetical protein